MAKRVVMQSGAEHSRRERQKKLAVQSANLKRWFKKSKKRRQADMARALGVKDFAVHAWCNAERCPSGLYPAAIEKYTAGEVKAEGWPRRTHPSAVQEFLSESP